MQLSNNLSIYNDLFNSSNLGLRVTNSFSDTSYFHENIQNSPSPLFNNHKLKFCNFNTNGAKRNLNFIQVLIMRNDFLFLCETWLLDYESSTFLNTLSSSHLVLHKSDMIITPTKGRPYGGRAFIVNKKFDIGNFEFLNKHVAYISLKVNNHVFTFIAAYLPFDNSSRLNLSEFLSCLQIIQELFLFFTVKKHNVFIIGDFNSDITRNNRFDIIFKDFITNNNLCFLSPSSDNTEFSYQNGEYKAKLDHCIIANDKFDLFTKSWYWHDVINLSDHEPLNSIVNYIDKGKDHHIEKDTIIDNERIIKLMPNLENDEINFKFNYILNQQMVEHIDSDIENPTNKQATVDHMYKQLTDAILFAFNACSSTTTAKKLKNKKWFTNELKIIKKKMLLYKFELEQNENNKLEFNRLKKVFKRTMKKNIYLYEKNEYFKIEKLIKCNNGDQFFKKVKKIISKDNEKINIDIETLAQHYQSIFNRPLNVSDEVINEINVELNDVSIENYQSISIS